MIRVFPRKTSWTPTDDLSFVGDPPIIGMPENQPVMISVVFTWDIPESERLYRSWCRYYSDVQMGGPAFDDQGNNFAPGVFVKNGITITSRGCTKNCDWCFVPKREGWIREIPINAGYDIADNNLLACSKTHIESVFSMLREQREPIKFSGGLDAELLQDWHVDLLKTIRLRYAWFACDYPGSIEHIERASVMLQDFARDKKRCYVLVGFKGESLAQAEKRLKAVYNLGFLPMAMYYRNGDTKKSKLNYEWQKLLRMWTRPAIYRTEMKKH